ncbi:uncharacterized protein [Patagioenas fasciata]|uniref:uncharacterized protein n=1 Tax=Patagioenas fasciata TaxID=372321 RepID=UPI003A999D73
MQRSGVPALCAGLGGRRGARRWLTSTERGGGSGVGCAGQRRGGSGRWGGSGGSAACAGARACAAGAPKTRLRRRRRPWRGHVVGVSGGCGEGRGRGPRTVGGGSLCSSGSRRRRNKGAAGPGWGPRPLPALSLVLAAVLSSRRRPPRPSAPVREGTSRRPRLPGGAGESPAEENSSIPIGLKGRGIRGGQVRDAERAGKKLGLCFCLCVVHSPCPDGVPASIPHRISPGKSASALHLKEPDLTQASVLLPSMFRQQAGQHRALRRALFCTDFYQTAATACKGRGCSQTLNKAKQLSNSNNHKNNKDDNTIRLEVGGLCPLSSCAQQTALITVEFLPETGLQIGLVTLLYKGIKGTIPALSPVSCLCIPL